ncbi:PilZ domain-containing protein [Neptuniibacter sp.]|uniref:PilZ domain-containing protein n=1 Tax=Neptuniibacter sp. TaxID=1962643 RepID=UPI00260B7323|nr:PilZ domain-containing protein [Neptuniibacter sp.]MCP4597224.1 PilZ domain-containing protein [Neptuniibacter sp.]
MTTTETERRRFTRVTFDATTELEHEGSNWEVKLVDISFNGILVKSEQALALSKGDEVQATIHLLGNDITIKTPATLAHTNELVYGFLIENLDLDSLTQLRRLIELNLGDEALLEREMDHLFHG